MKIVLSFLVLLTISACGGGAGGGGSTDTGGSSTDPMTPGGDQNTGGAGEGTPVNYPLIKPDPKWVGNQVTYDGKTFKVKDDNGQILSFSAKSRKGNLYEFATNLSDGKTQYMPMAMSNKDAIVLGVQMNRTGRFSEQQLFGYDGTWATNTSFTEKEYYGLYQHMSPNRELLGTYPMHIHMNLDALHQSYGVDLTSGEDIYIIFSSLTGNTLSGSISDSNADMNPASFGLFGSKGDTIAGGYSSELGTGILLVEAN